MSIEQKIQEAESCLRRARDLADGAEEELVGLKERHHQIRTNEPLGEVELTNRQAAALLGVSRRTVIRWKKQGKLEDLKVSTLISRGS